MEMVNKTQSYRLVMEKNRVEEAANERGHEERERIRSQ
jgi:hypothetical protein